MLLTIGLPIFFGWAHFHDIARLRAFRDHGVRTQGVVVGFSHSSKKTFVRCKYRVGNQEFTYSVDGDRAPAAEGLPVTVIYSPESPDRPWIGPELTDAVIASETSILLYFAWGSGAIFALSFLLNERQLRRTRARGQVQPEIMSQKVSTIVLSLVFYAIIVGVTFDPKVRTVQRAAFGDRPMGLPTTTFLVLLETLLFLPAPWFIWHAMLIVRDRANRGQLRSGISVLFRRADPLPPELHRSNVISIVGVCYFIAIATTWIVFASVRGL